MTSTAARLSRQEWHRTTAPSERAGLPKKRRGPDEGPQDSKREGCGPLAHEAGACGQTRARAGSGVGAVPDGTSGTGAGPEQGASAQTIALRLAQNKKEAPPTFGGRGRSQGTCMRNRSQTVPGHIRARPRTMHQSRMATRQNDRKVTWLGSQCCVSSPAGDSSPVVAATQAKHVVPGALQRERGITA